MEEDHFMSWYAIDWVWQRKNTNMTMEQDFISKLPLEIIENIFQYLDIKDLAAVQLVSKGWRQTINGRRPFYELVCDRLGVAKEEYGSHEEAIAICRCIIQKMSSPLTDWFTLFDRSVLGGREDYTDFVRDGQDWILVTAGCPGHTVGTYLTVLRVTYSDNNWQFIQLCSFALDEGVGLTCLKYCDHDAIFTGNYPEFLRWDITGQLVYRQLLDDYKVTCIGTCRQRDLLFVGTENTIHCRVFSTGEPLSVQDIPLDGDAIEMKLKPMLDTDDDSPIIIGVLSQNFSRTLDESHYFNVFSWSDQDQKLILLHSLTDVLYSLSPTLDGFRFMVYENPHAVYICQYLVPSNTVERQKCIWENIDMHIEKVNAIGSKYMILEQKNEDNHVQLVLFERKGEKWCQIRQFPTRINFQLDCLHDQCGQPLQGVVLMGSTDWLDGLRPDRLNGLGFAIGGWDDTYFAFWKTNI